METSICPEIKVVLGLIVAHSGDAIPFFVVDQPGLTLPDLHLLEVLSGAWTETRQW